jgi:uncharacterized protein
VAKVLLVIAVTVLVVLLFKSMGRKSGAAKPPQAKSPEDMVRCQVCGVNLPRSEAMMSHGRFYCCDQHRLQDQARR